MFLCSFSSNYVQFWMFCISQVIGWVDWLSPKWPFTSPLGIQHWLRTRTRLGDRAISVVGPVVWNSLY